MDEAGTVKLSTLAAEGWTVALTASLTDPDDNGNRRHAPSGSGPGPERDPSGWARHRQGHEEPLTRLMRMPETLGTTCGRRPSTRTDRVLWRR